MNTERACVDRIDEGLAVLLVGGDEREMVVPLSALPADAVAGDWLLIEIQGARVVRAAHDRATSRRSKARAIRKLRSLLSQSQDRLKGTK